MKDITIPQRTSFLHTKPTINLTFLLHLLLTYSVYSECHDIYIIIVFFFSVLPDKLISKLHPPSNKNKTEYRPKKLIRIYPLKAHTRWRPSNPPGTSPRVFPNPFLPTAAKHTPNLRPTCGATPPALALQNVPTNRPSYLRRLYFGYPVYYFVNQSPSKLQACLVCKFYPIPAV